MTGSLRPMRAWLLCPLLLILGCVPERTYRADVPVEEVPAAADVPK